MRTGPSPRPAARCTAPSPRRRTSGRTTGAGTAGRSVRSDAMASWRWWPGIASWNAIDAVSKRLFWPGLVQVDVVLARAGCRPGRAACSRPRGVGGQEVGHRRELARRHRPDAEPLGHRCGRRVEAPAGVGQDLVAVGVPKVRVVEQPAEDLGLDRTVPNRRRPTSAYSAGSFSVTSSMPMAWISSAVSVEPGVEPDERRVDVGPVGDPAEPALLVGPGRRAAARRPARRGSGRMPDARRLATASASSSRHAASPSQSAGPRRFDENVVVDR